MHRPTRYLMKYFGSITFLVFGFGFYFASSLGPAPALAKDDRYRDMMVFREYFSQAKKGSPVSQYMVGRSYELGKGIRKDDVEAAKWYNKADDGGFVEAGALLGILEIEGRGVGRDVKSGLKRLFSAAERGNILARYHLGRFYMLGKHVKKNVIEAYKWLFLASYLPRTPESFKAKELMVRLEKKMSKRDLKKSKRIVQNLSPE